MVKREKLTVPYPHVSTRTHRRAFRFIRARIDLTCGSYFENIRRRACKRYHRVILLRGIMRKFQVNVALFII